MTAEIACLSLGFSYRLDNKFLEYLRARLNVTHEKITIILCYVAAQLDDVGFWISALIELDSWDWIPCHEFVTAIVKYSVACEDGGDSHKLLILMWMLVHRKASL
jgi:hypothetical protein